MVVGLAGRVVKSSSMVPVGLQRPTTLSHRCELLNTQYTTYSTLHRHRHTHVSFSALGLCIIHECLVYTYAQRSNHKHTAELFRPSLNCSVMVFSVHTYSMIKDINKTLLSRRTASRTRTSHYSTAAFFFFSCFV